MLRTPCAILATILLAASAASASDDIDKVNGSVTIEANQTIGDVTTVNGSIHVGANAHAGKLETVNGSIELGDGTVAESANTVNGHVSLASAARIAQEVSVVNGAITLEHGAEVTGNLSNVNGTVKLDAAHVGGRVETTSGDIDIGAGSHVDGGLLVHELTGLSSWFGWFERKPRVIIGPHAVIGGTLEFRREVDLFISDSASIGTVKGATPIRFSGDGPPQ
jgi:hypothetical protein